MHMMNGIIKTYLFLFGSMAANRMDSQRTNACLKKTLSSIRMRLKCETQWSRFNHTENPSLRLGDPTFSLYTSKIINNRVLHKTIREHTGQYLKHY